MLKQACDLINWACLTLRVEQARHSQVSLCHTEGLFQVLLVGLSVHFAHVDESGTKGTQEVTISHQQFPGERGNL